MFAGKGPGDAVRVWTAACATGEEAYSIAMLLLEQAGRMDSPPVIQVFATDLGGGSHAAARDGLYPFAIQADVSEERLRRFFTKEHRGFPRPARIAGMRALCGSRFAEGCPLFADGPLHLSQPLIYLTPEAQKRAHDIAHFSLRPGGWLFIGSSESVDEESGQWVSLDKKHRLYRQRPAPRPQLPMPIGPGTLSRAFEAQERARGGPIFLAPPSLSQARAVQRSAEEHEGRKVSWEEIAF